MSRPRIALVVCLMAVLTVFVVWDHGRSRYDPSASYQDKIAYWIARIHTVGDKRAYEEMVGAQEGLTTGVEHVEAHIFGTALYRAEGIKGVAVCDDRFAYACFHQLIADAITDLGTESLDEIIEVCKGISGCRHGIGHGVLAAIGYSFDDLQKALSICTTLPNEVHVQGCYGGVFMEYNIRRHLGSGYERPIGEDWFDPCEQVSKSARRVCYFWQPTWWRYKLSSADHSLSPSALGRMGTRCRTVRNKDLNDACFEGIGVSALNAGRTTNDGISACGHVGEDIREQALCRTSVARYIALVHGTEQGRSLCLGLAGAYQESCLSAIESASPEGSYIGEVFPFEK